MTAHTFNAQAFALFVSTRKDNPERKSMVEAAAEAGVTKAQLFRAMHKQPVNIEAFLNLCLWMDMNPYAFLLDGKTGRGLAELPAGGVSRETSTVAHRGSDEPEYGVWRGMLQRCYGSNERTTKYYRARGITVCDRWHYGDRVADGFTLFLGDMGPRPSDLHSIDRIDNNGNYEPGNCRWATAKEQNRNTRKNHVVEYRGRTMAVSEAVELAGAAVGNALASRRIRKGWPVALAVETPPLERGDVADWTRPLEAAP